MNNEIFKNYSEQNKISGLLLVIPIFLIFIFYISPFKLGFFTTKLIQLVVACLLIFVVYHNYICCNILLNIEDLFTNYDLGNIRNIYLLNIVLLLLLLFLTFYLLKNIIFG
jgi:hypothetical protein